MGGLHAQMMIGMMKTIHDARALLTPEQRDRLTEVTRTSMDSGHMGHSMSCGMM
jgi:Spy/CpxP family protein refolding chaperone